MLSLFKIYCGNSDTERVPIFLSLTLNWLKKEILLKQLHVATFFVRRKLRVDIFYILRNRGSTVYQPVCSRRAAAKIMRRSSI